MSGAGVPFASFPGTVTAKGTAAHVAVHFDANVLASDRSQSILLGLRAVPTAGSSLAPNISKVVSTSGRQSRASLPQRGSDALAKSMFITSVPLRSGQAQDLSVDVTGLNGKLGGFNLEVFLPGDANGDRVVDATDLAIIDGIYGSAEGQSNFNSAADFNGDGHVGCIDRQIVIMNEGARTVVNTIAPVVVPAATPPAATPPAASTDVATVAAVTPVVTTVVAPAPVVTATPVVTSVVAVPATQVAPAPVQVTPSYQAIPSTSTVVVPIQVAPVVATVPAQPTTASPTLVIPMAQPGYSVVGQQAQQVGQSTPVYYTQPVGQPGSTVSLSGQTQMPGVAYYYGQPVVQAPGSGQTPVAQSTDPNRVYYFPYPIVQGSGFVQSAAPGVVSYYAQPPAQAAATAPAAKS